MRLFIAVQLEENMKKAMIGVMHDLKKQGATGNFVPAQNLHMTLAFIGEVKDAEPVKKVMHSMPPEAFRLALDGSGFFSDLMWVGVKGNQKLKKYAADLRKALKDAGIPCDDEKFVPHITVIRKYKGKRPNGLVIPKEEMVVKKVSLMKSETKDGKTVYKEIAAVAAGK